MRKHVRRRLAGLAFLSVLLGTAGATAVAAESAQGTGEVGTPLLSGRLLDHGGSPAAGVWVTVELLDFSGKDPEEATVVSTPVATTETDDQGYFSLTASRVEYGATYELFGVVDDKEVQYVFTPTEPQQGTARSGGAPKPGSTPAAPEVVVIKAGVGPLLSSAGIPRRVGPHPTASVASAVAALRDSSDGGSFLQPPPAGYVPDPDPPSHEGVAAPPAGLVEVPPADGKVPTHCLGRPVLSHIPGSSLMKYLPVRGILTGSHSTQDYIYTTATKTEAGGVMDIAGDLSAIGLMAGGRDSWSQTLEWPPGKLGNDTTWALKVEWDFEKWQEWCPGLHGAVKMNATQTLPWDVAGGSKHLATPMAVACNFRHPIDGNVTLNTSHEESFGGWFSIAGISLDTTTTQSTSTETTIIADNSKAGNHEKNPTYCSTASTLLESSWVREDS